MGDKVSLGVRCARCGPWLGLGGVLGQLCEQCKKARGGMSDGKLADDIQMIAWPNLMKVPARARTMEELLSGAEALLKRKDEQFDSLSAQLETVRNELAWEKTFAAQFADDCAALRTDLATVTRERDEAREKLHKYDNYDIVQDLKNAKAQLAKAQAEAAACLDFLKHHLNWEDFWSDGFCADKEQASQAKQNVIKLREFLGNESRGRPILEALSAAREALSSFLPGRYSEHAGDCTPEECDAIETPCPCWIRNTLHPLLAKLDALGLEVRP